MYDPRRDTFTITLSGQLVAMAKSNEGAFVTAFKQEMEAAMSDYNQQYISVPPINWVVSVKDAEKALKAAKRQAKATAKAERSIRKLQRQRDKDRELARKTLRAVCKDEYGQRVEAAKELLNQC